MSTYISRGRLMALVDNGLTDAEIAVRLEVNIWRVHQLLLVWGVRRSADALKRLQERRRAKQRGLAA